MGKKQELTAEQRLRLIFDLQLIDSKIDEIKSTRGELPLEIHDMEDEIEGMNVKKEKILNKIENQKEEIEKRHISIEESKLLIDRYTEQQKNVHNNREYEALSKEIEYKDLEIQLADKRIREARFEIEKLTKLIEGDAYEKDGKKIEKKGIDAIIEETETHLAHKRKELTELMQETEKQETMLQKRAEKIRAEIDARLLRAYDRLRGNFSNGLAVVSIERGASGGSYFTIPMQQQLEIRLRHKIVIDEHSGRILVDGDLAREEKEKINEMLAKI